MADEEDVIDRLLSQRDEDDLIDDDWARELEERKREIVRQKAEEQEEHQRQRQRRRQCRLRSRSPRAQPTRQSRSPRALRLSPRQQDKNRKHPPGGRTFLTNEVEWNAHLSEQHRRRRLKNVKSSFKQFPALAKHLFKQGQGRTGSKGPRVSAKGARHKSAVRNNERLRRNLKQATKRVLHLADAAEAHRTPMTQFKIDMLRATMTSKVLLHRVVPPHPETREEKEQFGHEYGGLLHLEGWLSALDGVTDPAETALKLVSVGVRVPVDVSGLTREQVKPLGIDKPTRMAMKVALGELV